MRETAVAFLGRIRYWDEERGAGLAVVDVPAACVPALGGLKQQRVRGSIGSVDFVSNVAPAGGGRLALSVSKAMMAASHAGVGMDVDIVITGIGRD